MFRQLSENILVSPQLAVSDLAEAARLGVTMVINNRPEGESEDQATGDQIAEAARAAGMGYVAIPVSHAGFSENQVRAMSEALAGARGPVLAYCRSGTRSTLLWALSQASQGADPDTLASQAAAAGYDLAPVRPLMDMLKARA
jgi:uncharacterized protein (TIGR01244 family)